VKAPVLSLLIVLAAARTAMSADVTSQPTLTLEGAKRVAAAALAYARAHDAPGASIAVVDAGGHTIYLERLDGTFAAGSDISIGKARTAVAFKRPTRGIEEIINKGRTAMVPVAGVTWFTPLQGGVPVMVGKDIVGGVGVSGAASAQQDEEVAIAGAQALQSTGSGGAAITEHGHRSEVKHVPAKTVLQAFDEGAAGGTLISTDAFRVNASRRDGPGEAEVHATDTDIFYVLEGSATVITGGELVGSREVAPGELRGSAIEGGATQRIGKGDVFTVPSGVPHWFKAVQTPFRYYVVKSVGRDARGS